MLVDWLMTIYGYSTKKVKTGHAQKPLWKASSLAEYSPIDDCFSQKCSHMNFTSLPEHNLKTLF